MKTSSYKIAFGAMAMLCIVLALAVAYLLASSKKASQANAGWPRTGQVAPPDEDPVIARGPFSGSPHSDQTTSPMSESEPALAPLQLSPQRMQQIGVTTALAAIKTLSNDLHVPGNVEINEEKLSYVQTRFQGWIQRVFANATYQYVRKGQPLFTVYSPDLVSSEQEYLLARKDQAAFSQGMHSDSMPGMAPQESGWLLQAATQRLEKFGVAPEDIANLEKTGKEEKELTVHSPVSGYVIERNALPNAYVQPETKLYTIADLSTVWVYANVFQNDVGRLRPGNRAKVTLDAYPGKTFSAQIAQILPQVDQATRTVRVRLVMANAGLALKPGMYVNVDIAAELGRQLVVPASAVLRSGQRSVAFLDQGEGNLEPRTVTTGPQIDGDIVILSGLKAGDRVVSSANFLIDSEAQLLSASQDFAPSASQAPANGSGSAEKLAIELSSIPSPLKTGSNTVRAKVTGPDGRPLSGSQVTVALFMPAMTEMGMAAMHATASLTEQNGGNYEGKLDVPMAGTWQVTVSVMRGGHVIATKRLSITTSGGM